MSARLYASRSGESYDVRLLPHVGNHSANTNKEVQQVCIYIYIHIYAREIKMRE